VRGPTTSTRSADGPNAWTPRRKPVHLPGPSEAKSRNSSIPARPGHAHTARERRPARPCIHLSNDHERKLVRFAHQTQLPWSGAEKGARTPCRYCTDRNAGWTAAYAGEGTSKHEAVGHAGCPTGRDVHEHRPQKLVTAKVLASAPRSVSNNRRGPARPRTRLQLRLSESAHICLARRRIKAVGGRRCCCLPANSPTPAGDWVQPPLRSSKNRGDAPRRRAPPPHPWAVRTLPLIASATRGRTLGFATHAYAPRRAATTGLASPRKGKHHLRTRRPPPPPRSSHKPPSPSRRRACFPRHCEGAARRWVASQNCCK
jgi:hypothetical protein